MLLANKQQVKESIRDHRRYFDVFSSPAEMHKLEDQVAQLKAHVATLQAQLASATAQAVCAGVASRVTHGQFPSSLSPPPLHRILQKEVKAAPAPSENTMTKKKNKKKQARKPFAGAGARPVLAESTSKAQNYL